MSNINNNAMNEYEKYILLNKRVLSWGNQLNVYNDGCQCVWCLTQIKEGFNKAIDELIEFTKNKENE